MSETGKDSPAPARPAPTLSLDEFRKCSLLIGTVTAAEDHPNADRLLLVTVDVGDGTPRQVVAGIKSAYQPAQLIGKQVVVVANLQPATIRGIESRGMILAAQDASGLALIVPDRPLAPGSPVK